MTESRNEVETGAAGPYVSDRLFTVPNILCMIRLAGSFVLVPIALRGQSEVFLWLFVFLAMTDWADGKLAILLNQRSIFGARLDSWADVTLYAALLFGVVTMYGETLRSELVWMAIGVASYIVSGAAGLVKFRRWPSYHTRAAKTSWLITAAAVVALFTEWAIWPVRAAALAVAVTNIEALLITAVSSTWRADVGSVFHAWRERI